MTPQFEDATQRLRVGCRGRNGSEGEPRSRVDREKEVSWQTGSRAPRVEGPRVIDDDERIWLRRNVFTVIFLPARGMGI